MTGERRSRVVLFRVCLSCVLQSWALGVGLADGRVSGLLQGASARALNLKLNFTLKSFFNIYILP